MKLFSKKKKTMWLIWTNPDKLDPECGHDVIVGEGVFRKKKDAEAVLRKLIDQDISRSCGEHTRAVTTWHSDSSGGMFWCVHFYSGNATEPYRVTQWGLDAVEVK